MLSGPASTNGGAIASVSGTTTQAASGGYLYVVVDNNGGYASDSTALSFSVTVS